MSVIENLLRRVYAEQGLSTTNDPAYEDAHELDDFARAIAESAFAEAFRIASQWPCGGIDPSTNATETREAYIQRMMEIARKGAK